MTTTLHWIEGPWSGRLAIGPRPRGSDWLEGELRSWHRDGIDVVVSLLTDDEVLDLELEDEARLCGYVGIQFLSFPITDRGVPESSEAAAGLVLRLTDELAAGKTIAIHCRQGIGRAGMIAATILALNGLDTETAIRRVSAARGIRIPEMTEQVNWIEAMAKSLLAASPK